MVGDPRSHRRCHSQRLVNTAEVVRREPASDSGRVVLPFLAEGVRKPGESTVADAGAEIRTLHDGGTDAFGIGLPEDWDFLHGSYFDRSDLQTHYRLSGCGSQG